MKHSSRGPTHSRHGSPCRQRERWEQPITSEGIAQVGRIQKRKTRFSMLCRPVFLKAMLGEDVPIRMKRSAHRVKV
jgi:hypothetical protein